MPTNALLERIATALEALVAERERAETFRVKSEENTLARHLETKAQITEFQAAYSQQMQALMAEQAQNEQTRKAEQAKLLEIMEDQERRLQAFIGVEPRKPAVLFDISDVSKKNKDKD